MISLAHLFVTVLYLAFGSSSQTLWALLVSQVVIGIAGCYRSRTCRTGAPAPRNRDLSVERSRAAEARAEYAAALLLRQSACRSARSAISAQRDIIDQMDTTCAPPLRLVVEH